MPNAIVWHGSLNVRPQFAVFAPTPDTKIARAMSPSMPSQFESTKLPSGSSTVDGGSHVPQPSAPPHVCAPTHTLNGVMMLHGCIAPGFVALQSHALLSAMHCRKFEPPTSTVWQL